MASAPPGGVHGQRLKAPGQEHVSFYMPKGERKFGSCERFLEI